MNCPRCEIELTETFSTEPTQVIEYNSCSSCEGTWVSKAVLNYMERIQEPVAFEFMSIDKKLDLISKLNVDELTLKHVHEYLMVKDLEIKYI